MKLKVALIQYDIIWEDVRGNLDQLSAIIKSLAEPVDLVVLPEMFSTGFSMNTLNIAQKMDGEVVQWMKDMAKLYHTGLMGTLSLHEGDHIYNRALLADSDGTIQYYDKRHLFRMGEENNHYTPGDERKIFNYKGVRIMPQICYDLRFPVWSRSNNDYDLLIYMANWPAARNYVWDVLLKARAIENQSYVIGVNRVGRGDGIHYSGNSMAIDYKGKPMLDMENSLNQYKVVEVDVDSLKKFKNKFPVFMDVDKFDLNIDRS